MIALKRSLHEALSDRSLSWLLVPSGAALASQRSGSKSILARSWSLRNHSHWGWLRPSSRSRRLAKARLTLTKPWRSSGITSNSCSRKRCFTLSRSQIPPISSRSRPFHSWSSPRSIPLSRNSVALFNLLFDWPSFMFIPSWGLLETFDSHIGGTCCLFIFIKFRSLVSVESLLLLYFFLLQSNFPVHIWLLIIKGLLIHYIIVASLLSYEP